MKPVQLRKCKKCEREKPLIEFPIYCREPERRRHECHPCHRARMNNHYYDNHEDRRQKSREYYAKAPSRTWTPEQKLRKQEIQREVTERLRSLIYHQYGNRCVCCGEDNPLFLTVDHVNNDGHKLRRQHGISNTFYRWIIANGFPDIVQLLCYNCNMGKARNKGVCPHQVRFNDYRASEYPASDWQGKRPAFICY